MRNDNAFIRAAASRLVARDLLGKPEGAEARRVLRYARRWDLDPLALASAVYCQAMLLKARVTLHEDVTRGE